MTKLEFHVADDQAEVVKAAVAIVVETMDFGAISNGVGSWTNREPLEYHCRKALLHITALWQEQNLDAREREEPHLKHLYNAVTRLAMARANQARLSKPAELLLEEIAE